MKKLLIIIGLLISAINYGQNTYKYPIYANGGLRVGENGPELVPVGTNGYYTTLSAAVAAGKRNIIMLTGNNPLTSDLTIPRYTTILFQDGAKITGNYTITGDTIHIIAGRRQIFDTLVSFAGNWDIQDIYPEWFGAIGDSTRDDGAALQSALNMQRCSGGKIIFAPKGVYYTEKSILTYYGGEIDGNNAKLYLYYSGSGQTYIKAWGSIGSYHSLSSDVNAEDNYVISNDSIFLSTLSDGDIIMLTSDSLNNIISTATYYGGELMEVKNISLDTIYFSGNTYDNYDTSYNAKIAKLETIDNINIHDITILFNPEKQLSAGYFESPLGLYLKYTKNAVVENININDSKTIAIYLDNCFHPYINNFNITGCTHDGAGYGIDIANGTKEGLIQNGYVTNSRMAITNGGSVGIPWNNKIINVEGTSPYTMEIFDSHNSTGSCSFIRCSAKSESINYNTEKANGFGGHGSNISILNCSVINCTNAIVFDNNINYSNINVINININNTDYGIRCEGDSNKISNSVFKNIRMLSNGNYMLYMNNIRIDNVVFSNLITDSVLNIVYLNRIYDPIYIDKIRTSGSIIKYANMQSDYVLKIGTLEWIDLGLTNYIYNPTTTFGGLQINHLIVTVNHNMNYLFTTAYNTDRLYINNIDLLLNNNLIYLYANYAAGISISKLNFGNINITGSGSMNTLIRNAGTIEKYYNNYIDKPITEFYASGNMPNMQIIQGNFDKPNIIKCWGTPEGQITAPVGAIAIRADGGTGTTMYVKESGTGNTGWVAK